MVTLDAVIVNVALPDIRRELSGGMSGLQWVADGYTLIFAALAATCVCGSDLWAWRGTDLVTLPLSEAAEGYRAMDKRRAIKTLLRP